ncbi:MAG: hypothetical protein V2A56_08205 [bacterium]
MDEQKKKELDELRKKIDPEVLKRVAESMGAGESGAAAAAMSSNDVDVSGRAPASSSGLSDLKARIRRREKELDAEEKKQPETKNAVFVVYAPTHFRAKTLGGYVQRMGFPHVVLCNEPQDFVKSLLHTLNDANVKNVAMVVYDDYYAGVQALLNTPEMQTVMEKLPKLNDTPIFAVLEENRPSEPPEGIKTSYLLTMRMSPEFNSKRIAKMMSLET